MRIAIASKDGISINQHFGHATVFWVYDDLDGGIVLAGKRDVENYCHGHHGSQTAMQKILATIKDCDLILSAKIGDGPKQKLANIGVASNTEYAYEGIEDSLKQLYGYV